MKTIQSQLICWLACVLLLGSLLGGGALCLWLRHVLTEAFDRSLVLQATTLQSLVTLQASGAIDVEIDLNPGRTASDRRHGEHQAELVQIDDLNGHTLYPAGEALLAAEKTVARDAWDVRLPSGRIGRAVSASFQPATEDTEGETRSPIAGNWLRITVARDRHALDENLEDVTVSVLCTSIALSLVAVLASVLIVRRGLRGLRGLATQVAEVDLARPGTRFSEASLPGELTPIAGRLDELLERMAATLTRERQFSVAASHELRTPIAELLVVSEVALRDLQNLPLAQRALADSHEIGKEMQRMVTTLLEIVRLGETDQRLPVSRLDVRPIVEAALTRHESALRERRLGVQSSIQAVGIVANESALRAVLDNLLANAARHAIPDSVVSLSTRQLVGRVELTVSNAQDQLAIADVEHVFEPFWQKDAARSGSSVGLGLTLVRAYCKAMGAEISARVEGHRQFVVTIRLPIIEAS